MLEDYDDLPSPAGVCAGFGAGAEVTGVANTGSGGGGKTVRFQSRPKKLGHIKEDSR